MACSKVDIRCEDLHLEILQKEKFLRALFFFLQDFQVKILASDVNLGTGHRYRWGD
jgi:hypothetical protein